MKRKLAALAVCLCVLLCGCDSLSLNSTNLMHPPKLSGEEQEIYAALTAVTGQNVRLRYPAEGKYRTAIVKYDLDDDSQKEAVVFYQGTDTASLVRINILEQSEDGWVSVQDVSTGQSQLQGVNIARVFEAGVPALLVSVRDSTTPETSTLLAYQYRDGRLENRMEQAYVAYTTGVLSQDGVPELFLICAGQDGTFTLECFRSRNFTLINYRSTRLASMTYTGIQLGGMGDGRQALFIDGRMDGGMATQVVYEQDGSLVNPLYAQGNLSLAWRAREIACMESDDGTQILIPTLTALPGYEGYKPEEQLFLTSWNSYGESGLSVQKTQLVSTYLGVSVDIPERWMGTVSAKYLYETNEVKFFYYDGDLKNDGQEYLRVRLFTKNDGQPEEGYTPLLSKGLLEYRMLVSGSTDDPLALSGGEAKSLVHPYNQSY